MHMAAVGNAEKKHRIAAGCVHKMYRMYADSCRAEKCAADTSVSKWYYLVHNLLQMINGQAFFHKEK